MIASMTGFARAQGQDGKRQWVWEARSVNGKGFDVRCRLPGGLDGVEFAAREAAAKRFKRGNINISLNVARIGEAASLRLNEELLARLVDLAAEWRDKLDAPPPRIESLMAIKGVVESVEEEQGGDEEFEKALLTSFDETMKGLATARSEEGARLKTLVAGQLDAIAALAEASEKSAALKPEAIRERLKTRIAEIVGAEPSLSEDRLLQEAALLAAKGDVREELDRLKAHIAAARTMLAQGGAVGRRFDFLCQEFNREANTLCSKSGDLELTRIGLELKAVIEQMREQIQNIE
jgi:uncharacterized protein (TIGR00255 family)